MRLRLDRLTVAMRGRVWRSRILLGVAICLLVFGALFGGLVVLTFVESMMNPGSRSGVDRGSATFCAFFGVLLPITAGLAVLMARARVERSIRELTLLVSESGPQMHIDRAALEARGWTRERAENVLQDALVDGLLGDDPSEIPPSLPPSSLPPPAVASTPTGQATPMPQPSLPAASPQPIRTPEPAASPSPRAPAVAITRAGRGSGRPPGATSLLTGRVLKGTYLVEEELGRGGMGAVHAARHLRTGRRYAVKTLLPGESLSKEGILRFEREARTASMIGHAGIVGVHDFDATEDGVHFLVMDLLEGVTLENRLSREGRLGWNAARRIALEISDAVGAAHNAGVLHRDLKPANVFLAEQPGAGTRAVLVDFGLAKPIEEGGSQRVTSTGAVVGTALYMSPEQARGAPLDVRSDVYGIAAVLYEMVTGVPPFLGPSALAVMSMVLSEKIVPATSLAPELPRAIDALLDKGLAKDPKQRFSTTMALSQALAGVPEQ